MAVESTTKTTTILIERERGREINK